MKLRILAQADCRAALDMAGAIEAQAQAFRLLAQGRSVQGLRSFVASEAPPGVAIFNPSFLRGGAGYGIKVISDFYDNDKRGLARMSGLVCLFDGMSGHPQAVLEAGHLTDLRTGAGTALAARYLARANSRVLALIGAGRVARNQLAALAEVFALERVFLSTRSKARAERFISEMAGTGGRIPRDIRVAASCEQAVRHADIIVAATTSPTPVIAGAWLAPGAFVAAVGAHQPTTREVDSRADCLDQAGDFVIPIVEGVIGREQVSELAEVMTGEKPARERDDEITVYKSIGVPIQDLVTAQAIAQRAAQLGLGTEIDIGGNG
jgi:ornithine cyclodeaminase/alanine dehydrogenase-like protein (mu-crystallin family)